LTTRREGRRKTTETIPGRHRLEVSRREGGTRWGDGEEHYRNQRLDYLFAETLVKLP